MHDYKRDCKGIYLRGIIPIGQFYESQRAIIGPAIDEAAEWHKKTKWIGVSTAPTAPYTVTRLADICDTFKVGNAPTLIPLLAINNTTALVRRSETFSIW